MRNPKSGILKMRFERIAYTPCILLCVLAVAQVRGMVLNEIMYNPDGDENTDEFIELYNESASRVYLQGWKVSDGEGVDSIVLLGQDPVVQPGQYVLILDPDYFSDNSTTYDGLIPEDALVVTINNSTFGANNLSNSRAEKISLINEDSNVVSAFTYSLGNNDGYSEEKILPEAGDLASNWTNSIQHHGTPGGRNSVTPPDSDLAISQLYSEPACPQAGDSFTIWCEAVNTGRAAYSDTLAVFEVRASPVETLSVGIWATAVLAPDEAVLFHARLLMENGATRQFCARLSGHDERSNNDERCIIVSSTNAIGTLLLNEIMYAPESQRSEWIELANATAFTLPFANWSIGDGTSIADATRRYRFPQIALESNGFIVIAADSSIFFENVPVSAAIFVWNSSAITLNNTGDSLVLYDADGNIADRVDYRPSWGDGENGYSLERISLHALSNDPLNWATSLDSTGATPGRINSRSLPESGINDALLTLAPNPFSPDGDGHDDLLMIRYNLEHADSRLDLKIYDVRGREMRRLANNAPAGYAGEVLWDGTSDSGRDLPTGIYIVYLEALGKGGTRIQSAQRTVALARRL
jgi:hypothetical protein